MLNYSELRPINFFPVEIYQAGIMCKGCSTLFHMFLVDIDITQKSHCKPHMNGRGISKFSLGWMLDIFLSAFFSLPFSLVFLVWPRLSYSSEFNVWAVFQSSHNHQSKTMIISVQLEPLKRTQSKELCYESYQNCNSRNYHHFEWNKKKWSKH